MKHMFVKKILIVVFLHFINWRNKSFVLNVVPRYPMSFCEKVLQYFQVYVYTLSILVSEIFPNNISLDVDKCKGKKISSVSEKIRFGEVSLNRNLFQND